MIAARILLSLPGLIKREYRLTEPLESEEMRREYARSNNPVQQFIDECCTLTDPTLPNSYNVNNSTINELYTAFKGYNSEFGNGFKISRNQFTANLRELFHLPEKYEKGRDPLEGRTNKHRFCKYLTLTPEAKEHYVFYPVFSPATETVDTSPESVEDDIL